MIKKIKTLLWFIKNPKYFSQIWQVLQRRKFKLKENTEQESYLWCEKLAISKEKAFSFFFPNDEFINFREIYANDIETAKKIENNCPLKMGGEGAIDLLYNFILASNSEKIIETGVAYGWSSFSILLAIEKNKIGHLISNDMPYIKMNNADFVGCIVPERLKKYWTLQRSPDVKGIPKAFKKFPIIDFFHYDSDKSYYGRKWSSSIIWKHLKKGGFFISDDINDNIAFKDFCDENNLNPIIIKHNSKFVGILKK